MPPKKLLNLSKNTDEKKTESAIPDGKVPESVDLTMINIDSGAWACYLDDQLVAWGGGEMTASELISALRGRAIAKHVVRDLGQYTPPGDFMTSLADTLADAEVE